jgi:hypothetical protein
MQVKKGTTYRGIMAIMLVSVYLLNPFKIYTPYLSYQINYNYIANVLCENKAKPEMHCQGKCHLNKELKKTAQEESQQKNVQIRGIEIEEIPEQIIIIFSPTLIFDKNNFTFYKEELISTALKNFTPPPKI